MAEPVSVQTVCGPVPVTELGLTLVHEHLWADFSGYLWDPPEPWKAALRPQAVDASFAWALREDPFFHPDNCRLDDVAAATQELGLFAAAGGRTVVEVTNPGMGRNAERLADIARLSGLHVVMGSGWYIGPTHGPDIRDATVEQLERSLMAELADGVAGSGIRPGVIGEIGMSGVPDESELRCLRAAARAQVRTGLPLVVHLDGWARTGHQLLDVVEAEGVHPAAVVLGHMNPSGADFGYQSELAARGAWLGYDMTGMGFYYADHGGQCPSPEDDATHLARLLHSGHGDRLLVSHDVFVKSMWTRNGGNGYGYLPRLFLPRLVRRHGVAQAAAEALLTINPMQLFIMARNGGTDQ
jgi:phosphotriesterase-related protein